MAQEWEMGGMVGYGYSLDLTAKNATGSADTGFKPNYAWGAFVGNNMHRRLGGEVRYVFRKSDLKVDAGGEEATMRGHSHTILYDLLFHAADRDEKVRPFLAAGGGARIFRGTGVEHAFQPGNQFVLLTKTQEILPVLSIGGGVKVRLSDKFMFRAEVRDYLTPLPQKLLAPAPGAQISGWLHDFVPTIGIAYTPR
jgi:hypothetical protein